MSKGKKSTLLNVSLWVAQTLLAGMFIMAGITKSFQPIETIGASLPWVLNAPLALIRFIGISELLGGIGLLLPSILRIKPQFTGYAAIGLALVMIFAAIFHAMRGEYSLIGINILIGLIAGFIAWGRLKKLPITPKS